MPVAQRPARVLLASSLVTATNVVPTSRADAPLGLTPTANQLEPAACASLNLATVAVGSGSFNGTNVANLMLGSAGVDTIRGNNGNDCILGGNAVRRA